MQKMKKVRTLVGAVNLSKSYLETRQPDLRPQAKPQY
jgi:hypothetical protein